MGGASSHEAVHAMKPCLDNAFQILKKDVAAKVGGGEGGYFGGDAKASPLEGLADYRNSLSSKTKKMFVQHMYTVMKNVGIEDMPDIDKDVPIEKIAQMLRDGIKKIFDSKKMSNLPEKQIGFCKRLAKEINKVFGHGVNIIPTDPDTTPEFILKKVYEFLDSFMAGTSLEFSEVVAGLTRSAKEMKTMLTLAKSFLEKIMEECRDDITSDREPLKEALNRLIGHIGHELEITMNLLNIPLTPAREELEIAMAEEGSAFEKLHKMHLHPGNGNFKDALAGVIMRVHSIASITAKIQKALSETGMAIEQYVNADRWSDFQKQLQKMILKMKPDDAGKIANYVNQLKMAFPRRAEIKEELEHGVAARVGGAPEKKTELERSIEKRKITRKLLLAQYLSDRNSRYEEIFSAVEGAIKKIDSKFPVAKSIFALRDALLRLVDMDGGVNKDLALIGFYTSADSQEYRETFVARITDVLHAVNDILQESEYKPYVPEFTKIKTAFADFMENVDYYTNVVTKNAWGKVGGAQRGRKKKSGTQAPAAIDWWEAAEEPPHRDEYFLEVLGRDDYDNFDKDSTGDHESDDAHIEDYDRGQETALGAAEAGVVGGELLTPEELGISEMPKPRLTFATIANRFDYHLNFHIWSSDLQNRKEEIADYEANYINTLGDAVASRIEEINKNKKERITALGTDVDPDVASRIKATTEAIEKEAKVKKEFWRTMESIEMFFIRFHNKILKTINAPRHIRSMLSNMQLNSNWYSELGGDELAKLFEMFPRMGNTAEVSDVFGDAAPPGHYYEKVKSAIERHNVQGEFGVAQLYPVHQSKYTVEQLRGQAKKVFKNFQALKNILNVFFRISELFGPPNTYDDIPMSPVEIYNNIVSFLETASVSVGVDENIVFKNMNLVVANQDYTPVQPNAVNGTIHVDAAEGRRLAYLTSTEKNIHWRIEMAYLSYLFTAIIGQIIAAVNAGKIPEVTSRAMDVMAYRGQYLGGADPQPQVDENATGSYFRLTLTMEIVFEILKITNIQRMQITYLPDLESKYTNLIRLFLFSDKNYIDTGAYSDQDILTIVRECNMLHNHFLAKFKTSGKQVDHEMITRDLCKDFIASINRRYGVVKAKEMRAFRKMWNETFDNSDLSSSNATDYSILPDEDSGIHPKRMTPSDRFTRLESDEVEYRPGNYTIDDPNDPDSYFQVHRRFNDKLIESLSYVGKYGSVSYREAIAQTRQAIHSAKTEEEKLELVKRLIKGSQSVSNVNNHVLIAFHETQITGQSVLMAIYRLLNSFRSRVQQFNLKAIINEIENSVETLYQWEVAAVAAAAANAQHVIPAGIPPLPANYVMGSAMIAGLLNNKFPGIEKYIRPGSFGVASNNFLQLTWPYSGNGFVYTMQTLYTFFQNYLRNNYNTATQDNKNKFKTIFARYVINMQKVMEDLILTAYTVSANYRSTVGYGQNLVQLTFPETESEKIHLDFNGLKGEVERTMAEMRANINRFRKLLPVELIQAYEDKNIDGVENVGSLGWLNDKLVIGLLKGVLNEGGQTVSSELTVEQVSSRLSTTFNILTQKWDVCLNIRDPTGINPPNVVANPANITIVDANNNPNLTKEYYGEVIAGLIHYNKIRAGPDAPLAVATGDPIWNTLIRGPKPPGNPNAQNPLPEHNGAAAGAALFRYALFNAQDGFGEHRSLMYNTNAILGKYLTCFFDAPSGTIFIELINKIATGTCSQSVMERGYAFPDLAMAGALQYGIRSDPTETGILYQSLAYSLQRIVNDKTPNGNSLHLIQNASDLLPYMRERIQCNLPLFRHEAQMQSDYGRMLRNFIQHTNIDLRRPHLDVANNNAMCVVHISPLAIAAAGAGHVNIITNQNANLVKDSFVANKNFYTFGDETKNTHEEVKTRLLASIQGSTKILDAISTTATNTLKLLAYEPVYMEVEENGIQNFKSAYGAEQLGLISQSLYFLSNAQDINGNSIDTDAPSDQLVNDLKIVQYHTNGNNFRMNYGARVVLFSSNNIVPNEIPGPIAAINSYNGVSNTRDKISIDDYMQFVNRIKRLLQYSVNEHSFCPSLLPSGGMFSNIRLFTAQNRRTYSLKRPLVEVLEITTSPDQQEQITKVCRSVVENSEAQLSSSRSVMRMNNLIDINLIPLDKNAVSSKVPMSWLFNLSSYGEYEVARRFDISLARLREINTNVGFVDHFAPQNTTEYVVKIIFNPFSSINDDLYGSSTTEYGADGYEERIARGTGNIISNNSPLRFWSDQVFCKALFGNQIPSRRDYDEGGPAVTTGILLGREGWRGPPERYIDNTVEALDKFIINFPKLLENLPESVAFLGNQQAIPNFNIDLLINVYDKLRTLTYETMQVTPNILAIPRIFNIMNVELFNQGNFNNIIDNIITDFNALNTTLIPGQAAITAINHPGGGGGAPDYVAPVNNVDRAKIILTVISHFLAVSKNNIIAYIRNEIEAHINNLAPDIINKRIPDTYLIRLDPHPTRSQSNPLPDNANNTMRQRLISYLKKPDDDNPLHMIKEVEVGSPQRKQLDRLGRLRSTTFIVRVLKQITLAQSLIQYIVDQSIKSKSVHTPLVEDMAMLNPSLTELGRGRYGIELPGDRAYSNEWRE